MRLFWVEIKRILKTKTTWILLSVALVLSIITAYVPVTFQEVLLKDENGKETRLTGLDAVHYYQQWNDTLYGEVTEDKVIEAIKTYQEVYRDYNSEYGENIPEEVFYQKLKPFTPYRKGASEILADRTTGISPMTMEMDIQQLNGYYDQMEDRLLSIIGMENPGHPAAQTSALLKFSKVHRPYTYYYGASNDSFDYQIILILLITLLCVILTAPVFSSDYQTGADDINRCSKYGGIKLAVARIFAALVISVAAFALCVALWVLLINLFFGRQGMETSIQMLYSITALVPWNVGQLQWYNMLYSLLFFVSTIAFTLFLSATMKSNITALSMALVSAILPMIIYLAIPEYIGKWVQCFLASGGIGLGNSILYSLIDYVYLHIGSISIWNVDMMLIVTAVEIPLFLLLAAISYTKKDYSLR